MSEPKRRRLERGSCGNGPMEARREVEETRARSVDIKLPAAAAEEAAPRRKE